MSCAHCEPQVNKQLVLSSNETTLLIGLASRPSEAIGVVIAAVQIRASKHRPGCCDGVQNSLQDLGTAIWHLANREAGDDTRGLDLVRDLMGIIRLPEKLKAFMSEVGYTLSIQAADVFEEGTFKNVESLSGLEILPMPQTHEESPRG
jgi:hypothetical protein